MVASRAGEPKWASRSQRQQRIDNRLRRRWLLLPSIFAANQPKRLSLYNLRTKIAKYHQISPNISKYH